jgi:multidrug resistance efflux pump
MKAIARVIFTLLIVATGGLGGYELWTYYMLSPWTRDARVQADVVTIAPDVSGYVDEIRVKDNQFVHKGDVLLVIDRARYTRALAKAEAVAAAQKAEMEMRRSQSDRRARLTDLAASAEIKENAQRTADATAASYRQAVADLSVAQLNLDRTVVRAPVNGFVTNLTLGVGQFASVGARVLALIDSDSYRVTGYFEETKIPGLAPGAKVDIQLMGGAPALAGHVESISRGITDRDNPTGPELLANAAPTFEWVRLAQRIPVRIHIDQVPAGVVVSSGMTCTVVVETAPRPWVSIALLRAGWTVVKQQSNRLGLVAWAADRSS